MILGRERYPEHEMRPKQRQVDEVLRLGDGPRQVGRLHPRPGKVDGGGQVRAGCDAAVSTTIRAHHEVHRAQAGVGPHLVDNGRADAPAFGGVIDRDVLGGDARRAHKLSQHRVDHVGAGKSLSGTPF